MPGRPPSLDSESHTHALTHSPRSFSDVRSFNPCDVSVSLSVSRDSDSGAFGFAFCYYVVLFMGEGR